MSNLNDLLENNIKTLINSANAVGGITHQGLKGTAREEYLAEFFEKYLPHQWGIGKGQIQDSLGGISHESDLIIYDRNSLPPTLVGKSINIFPIECVKYVFEVKSTLNATEVKTTIVKFDKLKSLYIGEEKSPVRVLFAFDSDLSKKTDLERLEELDEDFDKNSAVQVLIVIGKGYWFRANRKYTVVEEKKNVTTRVYYKRNPSPDILELKSFLFGVLDTLNPDLPSFSKYFRIPPGVDGKLYEVYEKVMKEEPYEPIEKEDLSNLILSSSLSIAYRSFTKATKSKWSIFKKRQEIENPYEEKYCYDETDEILKYSIPQCDIMINNISQKNYVIKSCHLLTSNGLSFFLHNDTKAIEFPIIINANETLKISSGFMCFKKHPNSDKVGGEFIFKKGDFYGAHTYKFKDKMQNFDYGVIELITASGTTKYSDEFQLTEFMNTEENINYDFILEFNQITRLLSGNPDYIKQIKSSHERGKSNQQTE